MQSRIRYENSFVPRRTLILIGGCLAAAMLPLAARGQSSFDAPPVPGAVPAGLSSPTASAVRGVHDNLDPMTSPAMPAGAAGVPAATFVAPSQATVTATEPLGPPIVPTDAQPITIFKSGDLFFILIHKANRFSKVLLNKCERISQEISRICSKETAKG